MPFNRSGKARNSINGHQLIPRKLPPSLLPGTEMRNVCLFILFIFLVTTHRSFFFTTPCCLNSESTQNTPSQFPSAHREEVIQTNGSFSRFNQRCDTRATPQQEILYKQLFMICLKQTLMGEKDLKEKRNVFQVYLEFEFKRD